MIDMRNGHWFVVSGSRTIFVLDILFIKSFDVYMGGIVMSHHIPFGYFIIVI